MQAPKRLVSDLRSTVETFADLVSIQQQEAESHRQQTDLDRTENNRRFEESRQQAAQDIAVMLRLIQAIARGRNGGV
jgi:hypothetical protein